MNIPLKQLGVGLILGLAALLMTADQPVQAQGGGTLGYGSKVYASLTPDFPTVTYSFNGTSGDWINASVNNWTGTLNPQIDLVAPDGQVLVRSTPNILNGDALDAHLSAFLPQAGIYSLRVTGHDGTTGDFLLALLGHGVNISTVLAYGQTVDVAGSTAPQFFTFEAQSCPTTLVIENPNPGQPFTYPFVAKLRDQRGETVALLRGGEQTEDRVTVAPNSGRYEVEISSADPALAGSVRLTVTCSSQAPGCAAGQAGIAGVASGVPMCTPCGSADQLVERGGCPDINLEARQSETNPYELSVSWDSVPGADGYRVTVYGYGEADGSYVYLTHSDWIPGNPLSMTWTLPDTYSGFEFKLDVLEGGHAVCTQRATQFFEAPPDATCAAFDVTGTIIDPAMGLVQFTWAPYPGATEYIYALFRIWPDGSMDYSESGILMAADPLSVVYTVDPDQDWQLRVRPIGPELPMCIADDTVSFGEEPFQNQETCGDFHIDITEDTGNSVTLSWPPFPGAENFTLSIWDASGTLVAGTPVLLPPDQTTIFIDWLSPGTYRIEIGPWTTANGTFCLAQVEVTIDIPAEQWTECSIHLDSPREGMANGLQDFYWSGGSGAVTYRLTIVNNETGAVVLSTLIPAPVTSTTADISTSAIGFGFDFTVIIEALLVDGSVWCSDAVREMREAPVVPGDQQVPPGGDGSCYALSTSIVNCQYQSGSVTVLTGQNCPGGYLAGTVVSVQANGGDPKCHVGSWSGCGASGNGNPTSITMNSSCSITATMSY